MEDIYFKAYNNMLQILELRKYVSDETGKNNISSFKLSFKDFVSNKFNKDKELDISGLVTPDQKPVFVVFTLPNQELTNKVSDLSQLIENHLPAKYNSSSASDIKENTKGIKLIIVHNNQPDSDGLINDKQFNDKINAEMFHVKRLSIDILNHKFMPRFELLSEAESKDITSKLGTKLAKISESDPVSRLFDAKPGQIFRITREHSIGWRIVVPTISKK